MKKSSKIALIIVLAVVAVLVLLIMGKPKKGSEELLLTANFVDIDKIGQISKFRSCQGHLVVPQGESETNRNMKHYVVLKPGYQGGGKAKVYSPITGWVRGIREPEGDLEGEISLGGRSEWSVSLLHLVVNKDIKDGQKINAGDELGWAADKGVDVVYNVKAIGLKMINGWYSPYAKLDSIFSHIDENVLAEYQAKGFSATDFIYTKEFRDQNPCELVKSVANNPGQLNDFAHPEDWVKFD